MREKHRDIDRIVNTHRQTEMVRKRKKEREREAKIFKQKETKRERKAQEDKKKIHRI